MIAPKPLSSYTALFQALYETCIEKSELSSTPDLAEVFKHPRILIILNHSTPLSWIPAICTLGLEANKAGAGDRTPRGIMDRAFYQFPFLKDLAQFITQVSDEPTFENIVKSFVNTEKTDLVIFPEGANSFFGDPNEIQSFRSNRFIEIAKQAKCPILIVAHTGSENWIVQLPIPTDFAKWLEPYAPFFAKKLLSLGSINFPLPVAKIPLLKMKSTLYYPEDISNEEAAMKVKALLESLLTDLKK